MAVGDERVPQGSVLGWIPFNLFINAREGGLTSPLIRFADDAEMGAVARLRILHGASQGEQHIYRSVQTAALECKQPAANVSALELSRGALTRKLPCSTFHSGEARKGSRELLDGAVAACQGWAIGRACFAQEHAKRKSKGWEEQNCGLSLLRVGVPSPPASGNRVLSGGSAPRAPLARRRVWALPVRTREQPPFEPASPTPEEASGSLLWPAPASAPISPGPRAPGLLGGQPLPGGVGGPRNQDLQLPKRRPTPGKRYQCSGDGCRLACRSMKELLDHMRVHYRPTQSVEGKAFRCSAHGCAESFPDMQALMGHVKAHYKLNRYFKCENCMSRFQTYRSLFKHLHSCTDSATSSPSPAPAAEKPVSVPPPGLEGDPVGTPPEELPKLQSSVRQNALLPGPMEAALAADPLPASLRGALESVPALAHSFPLLEQPLFGPPSLARFSGPPPPPVAGPFLPFVHSTTYGLPQAAVQSRLRPLLPAPGLPVSNAVWKKSQGHSSNSRIVWEHTRGRYTCMQCPYSTASREEMTQHIDDHRKNPSPPGRLEADAEPSTVLPSLPPKLPPEVEGSLFPAL
ncbi:zinc finger protein 414 [Varanus komodoensis]|uniref:zinc finger protein 414 n=1 Tax=Varanus komodoensis TaxID=61221 RepID=UPI001CF7C42F|nr:zinc finger protein 414 [Varanus komodoensis]